MSKIITLYGPDGSGKTTLAYALADRLADKTSLALIVHTDFTRPVVNERRPEQLPVLSLGHVLMTGDFFNLSKTYVQSPINENVFSSGILNDENFTSYGDFTPQNVRQFLQSAGDTFDYVIVDATDSPDDGLALASLDQCSHAVGLLPPNIQGVIFHRAYNPILERFHANEKAIYAAAKTVHYHNLGAIEKQLRLRFAVRLPYSLEVDIRSMSGAAIRGLHKKDGVTYEHAVDVLAKMVNS